MSVARAPQRGPPSLSHSLLACSMVGSGLSSPLHVLALALSLARTPARPRYLSLARAVSVSLAARSSSQPDRKASTKHLTHVEPSSRIAQEREKHPRVASRKSVPQSRKRSFSMGPDIAMWRARSATCCCVKVSEPNRTEPIPVQLDAHPGYCLTFALPLLRPLCSLRARLISWSFYCLTVRGCVFVNGHVRECMCMCVSVCVRVNFTSWVLTPHKDPTRRSLNMQHTS